MASVSATARDGSRVMIFTSEGNPDPLVYRVEEIKRAVAHLICEKTGKPLKVHRTRIREILDSEESEMNRSSPELDIEDDVAIIDEDMVTEEVFTETDDAPETEDTVKEPKAPKAPKPPKAPKAPKPPKAPKQQDAPTPVDFSALITSGQEVWTKENLPFDVEGVKVDAHCVVTADKQSYKVFNTYNGSLGKKGATGTSYQFNESVDIDKKRKALKKKGYVRRED